MRSEFLCGAYAPLVTPLRGGTIDLEVYAQLVEYQIGSGSHGIVVNGTTAEPSTLTVEERDELLAVAIETSASRLPVIAATGSQSLAETEWLSTRAVERGADALLIVTPYYVRPPARGMVEYFTHLGRQIELPWLLYHIPGRAAVSVDVDVLLRIREALPNFVGMKHASTDLWFVSRVLDALGEDFRVFVGLEQLSLPMMAVGACGMVNAASNITPARVARLYELVSSGDLFGARAVNRELVELNDAIFFDTNPIPVKYMMKRLGLLPTNDHRLPMVPASPELESRLDGVLARCGLLDGATARSS